MSAPRRTLRAPVLPPPAELSALRSFVKNRNTPAPENAVEAETPTPPVIVEKLAPVGFEAGPTPSVARINFNTRLAPDVDAALKRATLERKLNRQTPHTIQEIVDEALRPWLVKNGYLK